jgi:hypothetical protein
MSLWNPAKIDKNKQLELDKRVILDIAQDKLERDLIKAKKKLKKLHAKWDNIDNFTLTKAQGIRIRNQLDNICFEKDTIERRLRLISELGKGLSKQS